MNAQDCFKLYKYINDYKILNNKIELLENQLIIIKNDKLKYIDSNNINNIESDINNLISDITVLRNSDKEYMEFLYNKYSKEYVDNYLQKLNN